MYRARSQWDATLDAAIASSMFSAADDAKEKFIEVVAPILEENPDGEARVFVTGFRGRQLPRQFTNVADDALHIGSV